MRNRLTGLMALTIVVALFVPLAAQAQGMRNTSQGNLTGNIDPSTAARAKAKQAANAKAQQDAATAAAKDPTVLRAKGMALAPALIAGAGVKCTPTDASVIYDFDDDSDKKNKVHVTVVEVACDEGMGYALLQTGTTKPIADDCLTLSAPGPDGKPNDLRCILSANANPASALQPFLARAGSDCVAIGGVPIDAQPATMTYEIQCQGGTGRILRVAEPRSATSAAAVAQCLVLGTVKCSLSSDEANIAEVRKLIAKSSKSCAAANQRHVLLRDDNSEVFEFACQDGSGMMIHASAKGDIIQTITCGYAGSIEGGCKLTDGPAQVAQAANVYTQQVKSGGVNCDVANFYAFPERSGRPEGVEVTCANAPLGGVAVMTGGKVVLMDCARAAVEGFSCGLNPPESLLAPLTAQLQAKGKTTCRVAGQRPMAASTQYAYVEVACADGEPGFVLKYPRASNTPEDVLTCDKATTIAGGCQIASNKRA